MSITSTFQNQVVSLTPADATAGVIFDTQKASGYQLGYQPKTKRFQDFQKTLKNKAQDR